MAPLSVDLEQQLEAEDGVVEVERLMPHLTFPWASLRPGPRRWAPTDLSVETEDDELTAVRLTYRTVGDRSVVVAGGVPGIDLNWLTERLATPLLYAHFRKTQSNISPSAVMAALEGEARWEDPTGEGWRFGVIGVGNRPVRLAHRETEEGHLLVAAHGVASEELTTLVAGLVPLEHGSPEADDLHSRHRRALAQRWWDAPRTPWTPED